MSILGRVVQKYVPSYYANIFSYGHQLWTPKSEKKWEHNSQWFSHETNKKITRRNWKKKIQSWVYAITFYDL
jgi:hypothetical protein